MGVGGGWGTLKRVRVLLQSVLPMPRHEVWRLGVAAANWGCCAFGCGEMGQGGVDAANLFTIRNNPTSASDQVAIHKSGLSFPTRKGD
ncbi:hypothetical protein PIB30_086368 [Stylosanthes scabra]|uniref:Uncharacterized protein n=1 Tax=Stylosanthes scabra TaxID=79078 RepID=A0ABU6QT72_9FABA|nr:hypothetical protein [Stylosanthes scabra]